MNAAQHSASGAKGTVLIMAAGTGGHIFPALSIARNLQSRGYRTEWLGTPAGLEVDVLGPEELAALGAPSVLAAL